MSRSRRPPVEPGELLTVMFRAAARWALAAGLACVVAVAVAWGWAGLVGGAVGLAVAVGFYAVDVTVLWLLRSSPPELTAAAVLGEYVVKVLGLAVLIWVLDGGSAVDMHALALTVVVTTVCWVIALVATALRAQSFVVDPLPRTTGPPPEDHARRP